MPTLHRAVAFTEVNHVAVHIAHDLEFDVTRPLQEFLDVHVAVAKRGERFGTGELKRAQEVIGIAGHAHPLASPAGRRLDNDREADAAGELERVFRVVHRTGGPRHDWHAALRHRPTSRRLVAHHADLLRRGADEGNSGGTAGLGELRILSEKAVAWVDRVGTGNLGGGDQSRDLEVGIATRRGSDTDVIVGEAHMQRLAVSLGVHGDRLNIKFTASANDAESDLTAVSDQDLFEHVVWWQGLRPAASPAPSNQVAELPCRKPSEWASQVPPPPSMRSVHSAGLVAEKSAFS